MTTLATYIAPGDLLYVTEADVATGIPADRIWRLLNDDILPSSARAKHCRRRALRAYVVPMVGFAASCGRQFDFRTRRRITKFIEKFARENWKRLLKDPSRANGLRFEDGDISVDVGKSVREGMAGLNKLTEARAWVSVDPDVRLGIPTVRGTRIGIYEAADYIAGDKMEVVLDHLPSLCREAVEAAALFNRASPRMTRRSASLHPFMMYMKAAPKRRAIA